MQLKNSLALVMLMKGETFLIVPYHILFFNFIKLSYHTKTFRIMVHLERAEEDQEDEFADDDDYENDDDDNDSSSQNHNRRRMNEVFDFVANVGTRGGMSEREFYEFMFYELFHENVGANTDPARWTQQHDFYTRQREKERQELARERERKNAARRKLRDPLREHSAGTIKTCRRCAERYLPKADQRCDACGAAEPVLQTRLDEEKERAKATKKEKQGKKSSV